MKCQQCNKTIDADTTPTIQVPHETEDEVMFFCDGGCLLDYAELRWGGRP